VIDGTYGYAAGYQLWSTTPSTPYTTTAGVGSSGSYAIPVTSIDTGCQPNPSENQFSGGTEAYGTGHFFYDNEVENNSATGMGFAGSNPTNDITISSWNPYDPTDTPRYIENNGFNGILFLGPNTLTCNGVTGYYEDPNGNCQRAIAAHGITLDNVLARNNAIYGVELDAVSKDTVNGNPEFGGYYVGFINNACLNDPGDSAETFYYSPGAQTALSNPTPAYYNLWFQRTTNSPSNGQMTSCPATSWPAEPTPAPSSIPGWKW
jgi:hypothetical protein